MYVNVVNYEVSSLTFFFFFQDIELNFTNKKSAENKHILKQNFDIIKLKQ